MTERKPMRASRGSTPETRRRLAKRHAAERRFRACGIGAIALASAGLALLVGSVLWNGASAFLRTEILLDVHFDPALIKVLGAKTTEDVESALRRADFGAVVRNSLRVRFPDASSRRDVRALQALVSRGARTQLARHVADDPESIGRTVSLWVPAADEVDMFVKGKVERDVP